MESHEAVRALITDLRRQVDQIGSRKIKDPHGRPYDPAHYKRGLRNAVADATVVEFVRDYLYRPPSLGYKKLEKAESLDLAPEALVADAARPYASLFSDEDRATARERLGPHAEAIAVRASESRARMDEQRKRLRAEGLPRRYDLESRLQSRRSR